MRTIALSMRRTLASTFKDAFFTDTFSRHCLMTFLDAIHPGALRFTFTTEAEHASSPWDEFTSGG
jgi:hypothetical protein